MKTAVHVSFIPFILMGPMMPLCSVSPLTLPMHLSPFTPLLTTAQHFSNSSSYSFMPSDNVVATGYFSNPLSKTCRVQSPVHSFWHSWYSILHTTARTVVHATDSAVVHTTYSTVVHTTDSAVVCMPVDSKVYRCFLIIHLCAASDA